MADPRDAAPPGDRTAYARQGPSRSPAPDPEFEIQPGRSPLPPQESESGPATPATPVPDEAMRHLSMQPSPDEPRRKIRGLALEAKPKGAKDFIAGHRLNSIDCDIPAQLPKSNIPSAAALAAQNRALKNRTPVASPAAMAAFMAQTQAVSNRNSMAPRARRPNPAALAAFAAANQSINAKNGAPNTSQKGEDDDEDESDQKTPTTITNMVTNCLTTASGRLTHSKVIVGGQPSQDDASKKLLLFFLANLSYQVDNLLRIVITCNCPEGVPFSDSLTTWANDLGDRAFMVTKAHMATNISQGQVRHCIDSLEETYCNMDLFLPDLEKAIKEQTHGEWQPFPGTTTVYIRDCMHRLKEPLVTLLGIFGENKNWAKTQGGPDTARHAAHLAELCQEFQELVDAINEILARRSADWLDASHKYLNWQTFTHMDVNKMGRVATNLQRWSDNAEANQPIANGDDEDWPVIKLHYIKQMLDTKSLNSLLDTVDYIEKKLYANFTPQTKPRAYKDQR